MDDTSWLPEAAAPHNGRDRLNLAQWLREGLRAAVLLRPRIAFLCDRQQLLNAATVAAHFDAEAGAREAGMQRHHASPLKGGLPFVGAACKQSVFGKVGGTFTGAVFFFAVDVELGCCAAIGNHLDAGQHG